MTRRLRLKDEGGRMKADLILTSALRGSSLIPRQVPPHQSRPTSDAFPVIGLTRHLPPGRPFDAAQKSV